MLLFFSLKSLFDDVQGKMMCERSGVWMSATGATSWRRGWGVESGNGDDDDEEGTTGGGGGGGKGGILLPGMQSLLSCVFTAPSSFITGAQDGSILFWEISKRGDPGEITAR
jgi:hypothetical protein